MKKTIKRICIALGFVLCFGAGAGSVVFLHWANTKDTAKLQDIALILKNNWYYADQVENLDEAMLTYAVSGNALEMGDPFTQYLSDIQATQLNEKIAGNNEGIGIAFAVQGDSVVITDVYIDSPAENAGLRVGDRLVSINGTSITPDNAENIPSLVQGSDGNVEITVDRNGEEMTFSITPAVYDATVSMNQQENYGLVHISSFSDGTGEDFAKAVQRLGETGIPNLIIDLRDNTGGTIVAAIDTASSLLQNDDVVFYDVYADGTTKAYFTNDRYSPIDFEKIIILQNTSTASSSEILISALQDNLGEEVVTVGTVTYGKGSVQDRIPFSDGTTIKYTRSLWMTPEMKSINGVGITPDIEVAPEIESISLGFETPVTVDTVNPDARAVQILLAYLGYNTDRTDTYFSQLAFESLMQFQQDINMEADGIGDEETIQALLEAAREKASSTAEDPILQAALEQIVG